MRDELYFKQGKRELLTENNERIKTPWEGDYLFVGEDKKTKDGAGHQEGLMAIKESTANARLIAAAPEMFNLLREVIYHIPLAGKYNYDLMTRLIQLIEKVADKTIKELDG